MNKVIITGITGYLGSQIAKRFIDEGVAVVGLKRPSSDIWRCEKFKDAIEWVDQISGYEQLLIETCADGLIHSAWIGVEAQDRDDLDLQSKNVQLFTELLEVIKQSSIKKIIFLGSQAEYGLLSGKVSEDFNSVATTAYGNIKLDCLRLLSAFSNIYNVEWVWLRVFSLFGPGEGNTWLFPSLIKKMLTDSHMDFTKGDQKYAYLYIHDFTEIVFRVAQKNIASGIYNVSGELARPLKLIIAKIRDHVNPSFKLNFGALPYRENQSMHIEGDITKLKSQIGHINFTNFSVALQLTLNSYLPPNK